MIINENEPLEVSGKFDSIFICLLKFDTHVDKLTGQYA